MKTLHAIVFSILLFLPAANGQNGEIYGDVLDESNKNSLTLVDSVKLHVLLNNNLKFYSQTSNDGSFNVNNLPPGCYTILFSRINYGSLLINEIDVAPRESKKLLIKLNKGNSSRNKLTFKENQNSSKGFYGIHYRNIEDDIKERYLQLTKGDTTLEIIPGCYGVGNEIVRKKRKYLPLPPPKLIDCYESERIIINFSCPSMYKWIFDLKNKSYSEKDFKYIPFQHFLETLPAFQR